MSFERLSEFLGHIAHAVQAIESFTDGMKFEEFRADPKTVAAVERMLLTISEAAKRMGPGVETVCPGQPWHKIRGMGNWLRHQYDGIDLQSMWDTVTDDLPPLKAAVLLALAREKSFKPQGPA